MGWDRRGGTGGDGREGEGKEGSHSNPSKNPPPCTGVFLLTRKNG